MLEYTRVVFPLLSTPNTMTLGTKCEGDCGVCAVALGAALNTK
jgi:hypothetical protein